MDLGKCLAYVYLFSSVTWGCLAYGTMPIPVDTSVDVCASMKQRVSSTHISQVNDRTSSDSEKTHSFWIQWPLQDTYLFGTNTLAVGQDIQVIRCLPVKYGLYKAVVVGSGRIAGSDTSWVYAETSPLVDATTQALLENRNMMGNAYWQPMAGDIVVQKKRDLRIVARKTIAPRINFTLDELFVQDANHPLGLGQDLSSQGQDLLDRKLSLFASLSGRLLVEVHTHVAIDRRQARIDSLIRAKSIAQHIAWRLGRKTESIVAVGYGNDSMQQGWSPVSYNSTNQMTRGGVTLRLLPK